MEIPMFPELTFEEGTHTYKLNGIEIPSVTTLMQPLSRKVYGDTDPDVLARAAARFCPPRCPTSHARSRWTTGVLVARSR